MLKVNGLDVKKLGLAKHFPDGTQLLEAPAPTYTTTDNRCVIKFEWAYENDEELVTLMFLSGHYREYFPAADQYLTIKYIPNARMDRVKNDFEVFTLKHFCRIINSLGFTQVLVLDPHSNVSTALIDRVSVLVPNPIIRGVVKTLDLHEKDYIYYPDEGAAKRYSDLFPGKRNVLIGHKKRDWTTGKILGLEITGQDGETFEEGHFMGCSIIMIDDIISYGGTLAYSADELKRLGFKHIYAYASHTENSVLDEEKGTLLKRLNNGTVDRIFTTDSIYSGNHEKITVVS